MLTIWLGQKFLAEPLGLHALPGEEMPTGNGPLAVYTVYFIPGAIVGGVIGWLIIRPVNAVLGSLFRGFNRLFDSAIAAYGRTVGRLLRISAIVLMASMADCCCLTYWQFVRTPTGFIPQQDKGYLLLNVQLPDSASVERTRADDGPHRRGRPATPTAWPIRSAFPGNR